MGVEILNTDELMKDSAGRNGRNSVFGQVVVGEEITQFASLFAYPPDSRKLVSTTANGGTVTQSNSMLNISTGTAVNGMAYASSRRALQYVPGKEAFAKFTTIFTLGRTQSRQMLGLFDDLNGFAVGMEGDKLAIFRKKGGSIVETVLQSDFNRDKINGTGKSKFNIDPSKGNVWKISFGFLGFANVFFEVLCPVCGWILVHSIEYPNNNTEPHITLPYLKLGAVVENLGNNTDVIMKTASVEAGVVDGTGLKASTRDFTRPTTITGYTSGTNKPIIVFHNKATYGGVQNRMEALLNCISAAVDGTKNVSFGLYKLASAPTGGVWTDQSTNSALEYNTTATISLTNAEMLLPFDLSKNGQFFEIVDSLNLRLLPDEYAAFVFTTTGSGDMSLSIRWKELF